MNKYFKALILLLCACMVFSLAACSKKAEKAEKDLSSKEDITASQDENVNTEELDDFEDDSESDEETDDWESLWSDDTEDDIEDDTEDLDFNMGLYTSAEVTLKNGSAPIQKDFLGFNAIYHAYTFRADKLDRVHSERTAKAELDAVQKSGINIARTYFDYTSAWDVHKRAWDFESTDMKAFYRWCSELKSRGVDVHLSYWSAFSQVYEKYYTHEDGVNLYKEGSKPAAFYVDGDEAKTLDNFAEFINNLIKTLHAKGLTNVKYLSLSTEPGFAYFENPKLTPEKAAEIAAKEFLGYSNAVHNKLLKSGLRKSITIIGPNEGASTTPEAYMSKAVAKMDKLGAVDLYSSHSYYRPGDLLGDGYLFWDEDIKRKLNGLASGKDKYIYDEYGVILPSKEESIAARNENPYYGTQLALQQIATLNNGLRGSYAWTLMDQQWPNNTTNNYDAFTDGVHYYGILPNFQINNIPHPGFYAFQLMATYLGRSGSEVYAADYSLAEDLSVYTAMVKSPDGNVSLVVANANQLSANVKVNFEKSLGKTLYRHEFDPLAVKPTADATVIPPSAKITNCKKSFTDVIPALGIVVYTTKK